VLRQELRHGGQLVCVNFATESSYKEHMGWGGIFSRKNVFRKLARTQLLDRLRLALFYSFLVWRLLSLVLSEERRF
jgi:hypothetical protein